MAKEKTEVTPPVEETTEEVVTPPETETQEDLQAQLDAAKAEAVQNLELYKDSQRKESKIAERERKQNVLDSLSDRFDVMDVQQGETWDAVQDLRTQQLGGTDYQTTQTYQPPQRRADQIRSQQETRKQTTQAKVETPSKEPPEDIIATIKIQQVMDEMGWDENHPSVKKILHLQDDRQEALKVINKEAKTQRGKESDERLQKALKDAGITTPETAGPSGQGTRSYTPAQIAAMPYAEYEANKESIEKAYRAGNIK